MHLPRACVYEVKHCAYALLRREEPGAPAASTAAQQPPLQGATCHSSGEEPGSPAACDGAAGQLEEGSTGCAAAALPPGRLEGAGRGVGAWALACGPDETGVGWLCE